jgi:trans-aconitate 2-methyltransferase
MITGRAYRWDAKDYARHSVSQLGWARQLLSKLHLKGDEYLLDLGCGDGKVTAEIARTIPYGLVIGIDNASSMINLANATFATNKFPNLKYIRASADTLPFCEKFDVIFSNAALHWIKDHKVILKEIAYCLRDEGRVIMQMGGKGNAAEVISVIDEFLQLEPWRQYFKNFTFPYSFYTPEDYRKWIAQAGLKLIRSELLEKDMQHAGPNVMAGWIRTTWLPYTERIPEKKRESFVQEVVQRYIDRYPVDREGNIHVKMVRLEVEAIKRKLPNQFKPLKHPNKQ